MTLAACERAQGIPENHHVWRQAKMTYEYVTRDTTNNRWILAQTEQAFRFSPDISVLWREHLESHGISYEVLVANDPDRFLVFEAKVSDVRDLSFDGIPLYVVYTPMPVPHTGCAHASILAMGLGTHDKKQDERDWKRIVRELLSPVLLLTYGECTLEIPPGSEDRNDVRT